MASPEKRSKLAFVGRTIFLLQMWWSCLSLFALWDLGHAVLLPTPILMGLGAALTLFFIYLVSRLVPPPRRVLVAGVALAICGLVSFAYPKLTESGRKPASGSREIFFQRGHNCESLITKYLLPDRLPGPLFGLAYFSAALDDACRVQRLTKMVKERADLLCSDLQEAKPVSCFVHALGEISSRAPFTVVGNVLELSLALSVVNQEAKLDRGEVSAAELGLRTSIHTLQVLERALLDYRTILSPKALPGYVAAGEASIQQKLVEHLDKNSREVYRRLLPIQTIKAMKQASAEFEEFAPKVTEDKKARYADRYQSQKERVNQLLTGLAH